MQQGNDLRSRYRICVCISEMRYAYGINSPRIAELRQVAFESQSDPLPLDQRHRLQCLARAIEHE